MSADPDLELCVLLPPRERAEEGRAGLDFAGEGLKLAAGEMDLRIPEEPVFGGEIFGESGLKPVKLAADLMIVVHGGAEDFPSLLGFAADLFKGGMSFTAGAINLVTRDEFETNQILLKKTFLFN